MSQSYDAVLIVSFGGPEGPNEVIPFLENVLRGRNVPRERMLEVAEHYQLFGGVSPINEQNRALVKALGDQLASHGPKLPIYWGNRNWHPLLTDVMQQMADDGVRRALAFVTSAFSSYSGCRQYREDIARSQATVGPTSPVVDKLRVFYNHPGFVDAMVDRVVDAIETWTPEQRQQAAYVFTAHSIPLAMAQGCRYEDQLRESCRLIAERAGLPAWKLVYQSRSGPPSQPWLEPDICDHIQALSEQGVTNCVVIPVGFISDHMEVVFDLDTEAQQRCQQLGMNFVRCQTAGTHPKFIRMIRQLIMERLAPPSERQWLGTHGPSHDVCPADCCPSGRPNQPS